MTEGLSEIRSFYDSTPINFNPHHSWLSLTQQQNLTLFRGRAGKPEVERPKFRKDAKPTERSLKGKLRWCLARDSARVAVMAEMAQCGSGSFCAELKSVPEQYFVIKTA